MSEDGLRLRVESVLLRLWYSPVADLGAGMRLLRWLLRPPAAVVAHIARRRRRRIRPGAGQMRVPVIVVGNLVAGGTGKSPIVQALALALQQAGMSPGIMARSYRASARGPVLLEAATPAALVGDEAVSHARATGLPVVSGPSRLACLRTLEPVCDVVLSDDGLQHTALPRHLQIVVVDDRGMGNGLCLPAGPLREPMQALAGMDAIVRNVGVAHADAAVDAPGELEELEELEEPGEPALALPQFHARLEAARFVSLDGRTQWRPQEFVAHVGNARLTAVAGIARPERFFRTLQGLGLAAGRLDTVALPDHARLAPQWLEELPGRYVLLTSKDAAKCRAGAGASARLVVLEMRAVVDPRLIDWLVMRVRSLQLAMPGGVAHQGVEADSGAAG